MQDFDSIVAGFLPSATQDLGSTAETKKASLPSVSTQKQADVAGKSISMYGVVAGRQRNTGINATNDPVQRDLMQMNNWDLVNKYGAQAGDMFRSYSLGSSDFNTDVRASRSMSDFNTDSWISAGLGFVNGIGGLGALGLGAVNADAGRWASDRLREGNEWAQGFQSPELQANRRANAAVNELDFVDNKAMFESEKPRDGTLVASLKRFGRDAIDAGVNVLESPTLTSDIVASGIGSLFSGGFVSKGLKVVGKAALSRIGASAVAVGENITMPLAIGGVEAGGAYQETFRTALEELAGRDDLTESQKNELANRSALVAAAIQGPVAAASGRLVSRFESAPFRVGSVRGALANMGKETIEEATQSGSAALATNIGLRQEIDPDRDLVEGVGEQVALGAIGGLGTAGVLQAPGVAMRGAIEATKLAGRTAMRPINMLLDRGDAVLAANEQASPVSDEVVRTNVEAAKVDLPVVEQSIREALVQEAPVGQAPQYEDQLNNFRSAIQFNPSELDNPNLTPIIREYLSDSTDRFDAISRLSQIINNTEENDIEHFTAGAYLFDMMVQNESVLDRDLPTLLDAIPSDSPARQQMEDYASIVQSVFSTPATIRAVQKFAALAQQQAAQITPENISNIETPEAQLAARQVTAAAEIDPVKLNHAVLTQVLNHAEQGKISLSPRQIDALKAAAALASARDNNLAGRRELQLPEVDIVSREMRTADDGAKGLSLAQHMGGVVDAYRKGDREGAVERLGAFANFAQHMQNKTKALNDHFLNGDFSSVKAAERTAVKYQSLVRGKWMQSQTGLSILPYAPKSVEFAQRLALDAQAAGALLNNLVQIFPDLGVAPVIVEPLNPALLGPAQEVSKDFREGRRARRQEIRDRAEAETAQANRIDWVINEAVKAPSEPAPEVVSEVEPEVVESVDDREATTSTVDVDETSVDSTQTEQVIEEAPGNEPEPERVKPYADLIGSSEFQRVYSTPDQVRTRTSDGGNARPFDIVRESFKTDLVPGLTKQLTEAYGEYLDLGEKIAGTMKVNLQAFLPKTKGNADAVRWLNGKALNITELVDGKIQYNEELLQNTVLAGLQWVLSSDAYQTPFDERAIASILNIAEDDVTDEHLTEFDNGMTTVQVKESLAQKIGQYLGMSSKSGSPIGLTDGIHQALAAEVARALLDQKILEVKTIKFEGIQNTPDVYTVAELTNENPIQTLPDVIEQMVMLDPERTVYIGTAPTEVARTQLRNPMVENTQQQQDALREASTTPYTLNERMGDFLSKIGKDGLLKIARLELGVNTQSNAEMFNKNHLETLKGQRTSMVSSFETLTKTIAQMNHHAETNSIPLAQVEMFFDHNMSKVGRMQQLGKNTPQASKLMREVLLPTGSTLDLSSEQNADFTKFGLGIAQALGVKVHNMAPELAIEQAVFDLGGKYYNTFKLMQDYLNDSSVEEITSAQIETIRNDFTSNGKSDFSFVALHAIMEYARYMNMPESDRSSFETKLYLEADGMTNGAVNAMALLTTGRFTPEWLVNMGRGGFFMNARGRTANEHRTNHDTKDLYQATSDALQRQYQELKSSLVGTGLMNQVMNMQGIMSEFMDGFSMQGEQPTFKRNITKNPLTVVLYGSGVNGIAGKMTTGMVKELYARLSGVLEAQREHDGMSVAEAMFPESDNPDADLSRLEGQLEALTNNALVRRKGELTLDRRSNFKIDLSKPESFTLGKDQMKNLQQNMRVLMVDPMRAAIEEVVGPELLDKNTGSTVLLRKAVQVQSLFLQYAFQKGVQKALTEKAKDPNWKKSDFLSQKELQTILRSLEYLSPLIQTGTQTFFPAGNTRGMVGGQEIARGFDDSMRTDVQIYAPEDAGVAGIPTIVIGTGDGNMVQLAATNPDGPKGALYIFDGINMMLSNIYDDSVQINKAVFDSWQGNPIQDVSNTFSSFMQDASFQMTEDQRKALSRALFDWKEEASVEQIRAEMKRLEIQLEDAGRSVQARHNVLKRMEVTVDQMAAAGSPYVNEGVSLNGLSNEETIQEMNRMYGEEMRKLVEAPKPSQKIAPELSKVGTVSETGARTIMGNELGFLVQGLNIPSNQKELMSSIVESLSVADYRLVIGDADQISRYAEFVESDPITLQYGAKSVLGQIHVGKKLIYVANPTAETLLHELIHAATFEKVAAYYDGQMTGSNQVEQVNAIKRIEALMDQFINLETEMDDATQNAVDTIQNALNSGNQAVALNEFMAWSLSNPDLIRVQARTQVTNPLARIAKGAWQMLKRLIWGKAYASRPADDIHSNLRFNTEVLIHSQGQTDASTMVQQFRDTVLFQSVQYGTSPRLTALNEAFDRKVVQYMQQTFEGAVDTTDKVGKIYTRKREEYNRALTTAGLIGMDMKASGFNMSMQESTTFDAIVGALSTGAVLDPNVMNRAQDLFTHVTKNLTVESFMNDPNDDAERYYAQQKFNAVVGKTTMRTDEHGRSTLLSTFLALSMVNDEFRSVISKIEVPKTEKNPWNKSIDGVLDNIGNSAMDALASKVAGEKLNTPDIRAAIDSLGDRLIEVSQDREMFIERTSGGVTQGMDAMNNYTVQAIEKLSDRSLELGKRIEANANNKVTKAAGGILQLLAAIATEKNGKVVAEGVMSSLNRTSVPKALHDMFSDLIGRSDSNAAVWDMIKAGSFMERNRQQFREALPATLAEKFSRKLTDQEWIMLNNGLGKTDLMSLSSEFTTDEVIDHVLDAGLRSNKISQLEQSISSLDPKQAQLLIKKSKQLAAYMNTGIPGTNLLSNAYAIAELFNEGVPNRDANGELTTAIDKLVSLYALDSIKESDALSSLVQAERAGTHFLLSYLKGQRKDEMAKSDLNPVARANQYKGYVPSLNQSGVSLIVAQDTEFARLVEQGYVRVENYTGSSAEYNPKRMGYYYSPVSGRSAFQQGIAQNIRQTVGGVDLGSGFTNGMTAGRITDIQTVRRIQKNSRGLKNENATEALIPRFDEQGSLVAYERSVDPKQIERLNQNNKLHEMIGVWRGRQVEEEEALILNRTLVERLKNMYDEDIKSDSSKRSEYIDLFDETKLDPVVRDAVRLFTPELRSYAEEVFGENFYVRKDMLDPVAGYRSASIGDAWTGVSRLSDDVLNNAKRVALGMFGNQAYTYMVNAEKVLQNFVSDAKTTIVVRSVVVPVANIVANVKQLAMRGVPLLDITRKAPKKTAELESYVKSEVRRRVAEAELRAASNPNLVRRLEAELQSIKDANKRLSIWPLIEAGEFSTIAEDVSIEDTKLTSGRLSQYMEGLVDKLPDEVRTAGRYAIISRDTALFRGLQKSVQYGDFLAKAIMYDDMTIRQKLPKEKALGVITEEFVNYDRLPGRFRGMLESNGLLWFYNFKIRSAKVAVSMLRNNPIHSLVSMMMLTPDMFGSIGTPVEDNLFTVAADGRLDYSIGPSQGIRAPFMNPWLAIAI